METNLTAMDEWKARRKAENEAYKARKKAEAKAERETLAAATPDKVWCRVCKGDGAISSAVVRGWKSECPSCKGTRRVSP